MDSLQLIGSFVLVWALFSVAAQLLFAYSLQAIADKNELPELARFLAWIPLLQLYPVIRCGGGSFSRFLFGVMGFLAAAVALFFASASLGESIASKALVVMFCLGGALVALAYMARIWMRTAERRGLPSFVGLLCFVPVLNFFVYPYIAFHDGFVAPSKAGLVIGLLLAASPMAAQYRMLQTLGQDPGALLQAQLGTSRAVDPQVTDANGALHELAAAAEAARLQALRASRDIQASGADETTPQIVHTIPEVESLTANASYEPSDGFLVPDAAECPSGATRRGAAPPEGSRQWCERTGQGDGVKHGWFSSWHPNGARAVAGEYYEGLRVGVWTRWYPDGAKRAQAQFDRGLQDGLLIAWDDKGDKVMEQHFRNGEPVQP